MVNNNEKNNINEFDTNINLEDDTILDNSINISNINNGDNDKHKKYPRGLTPPVDGEKFNIKRSYQFRESTLRKLNQLKANDPNINIYLNQILDKAICFYYNHVFNKK